MASKKEESVVDVQETIGKAERYFEENQKSITLIGGIIAVLVGGYLAYTQLYLPPLEKDAREQMFMAEMYFEKDSLDKAINGDGQFYGFKEIIDNYGSTASGNLAHLYLGLCYLNKGMHEEALAELKSYDADDIILGPVSIGALGDVYAEMGNSQEAVDHYLKAAETETNEFTAPIYLMKAGTLLESQNNFEEAIKIYDRIRMDFPESREGRDIEKYIARAKSLAGNS